MPSTVGAWVAMRCWWNLDPLSETGKHHQPFAELGHTVVGELKHVVVYDVTRRLQSATEILKEPSASGQEAGDILKHACAWPEYPNKSEVLSNEFVSRVLSPPPFGQPGEALAGRTTCDQVETALCEPKILEERPGWDTSDVFLVKRDIRMVRRVGLRRVGVLLDRRKYVEAGGPEAARQAAATGEQVDRGECASLSRRRSH